MPDDTKKNRSKVWPYVTLIVCALALYIGTYVALSTQGRYEASVWGANHVNYRRWVPRGFETSGDWNVGMVRGFLPMFWLDHAYWHTPGGADSGDYPVNPDDYYMFPKRPSATPNPNSKSPTTDS